MKMKILLIASLLFGFSAFAQDAVQPTPTDGQNNATQAPETEPGSATVQGTPAQEKQLEENKAAHDHKAKAHHAKAKAHAKAHGKKVAKKAKKKKHKKNS
jgi:uncharacterized protein YdeI (BOF family)